MFPKFTIQSMEQASEAPWNLALGKKATIHKVTIMLSTSKNVLFPGHNLLTTGADDQTL